MCVWGGQRQPIIQPNFPEDCMKITRILVGYVPPAAVAVSRGGGGCLPMGVSDWGWGVSPGVGVSAQGWSAWGGVSVRTESQTGVKTLPCRNYVADGKNWAVNLLTLPFDYLHRR